MTDQSATQENSAEQSTEAPAKTDTIANLDSVFSDDTDEGTAAEEVTNTEETEAVKTDAEEVAGDNSEDEAEEAEDDETGTPPDEKGKVPYKAYKTEKAKRQELEKKLKQFEANQQEPKAIPDAVEDPEGFAAYQKSEAWQTKATLSRDVMLSLDAYKDSYVEMESHFVEMCKNNPHLVQKMMSAPNPAMFAFKAAQEDKEIQKLRDPKYKENLEKEIREKILAETGKQNPSKADKRKAAAVSTPDLTKAAAAGSNSDPVKKAEGLNDMFTGSPF
jgi:hypothetical protein